MALTFSIRVHAARSCSKLVGHVVGMGDWTSAPHLTPPILLCQLFTTAATHAAAHVQRMDLFAVRFPRMTRHDTKLPCTMRRCAVRICTCRKFKKRIGYYYLVYNKHSLLHSGQDPSQP